MELKFVKQWEDNKHLIRQYFETTKQTEFSSYSTIVEKLFELVIEGFDTEKMTTIDNGHYQGTLLFIIPRDTYQPSVDDYVVTHVYYGSCSGCDTLQAICRYEDGLPDESQVSEYMTLALHLVQHLRYLA